jgi:hypothetical protein
MERFALRHAGLHMELATKEELESPEKGLNCSLGRPMFGQSAVRHETNEERM